MARPGVPALRRGRPKTFKRPQLTGCRGCGGPLIGRQRSWCSAYCVELYQLEHDHKLRRHHVRLRDKGVCALCGLDADAVWLEVFYPAWLRLLAADRRIRQAIARSEAILLWELEHELRGYLAIGRAFSVAVVGGKASRGGLVLEQVPVAVAQLFELGTSPAALYLKPPRDLWEADHIVPRAEGGTNALDNFRTLCRPCHVFETSRLAEHRAKNRRRQLLGVPTRVFSGVAGR